MVVLDDSGEWSFWMTVKTGVQDDRRECSLRMRVKTGVQVDRRECSLRMTEEVESEDGCSGL